MKIRRVVRIAALALLTSTAIVVVPTSSAGALPPFTCGTVSGGSSASYGHITAIRVGHSVGFDRFVVQFSGSGMPRYTVTPKTSAVFWLDPSNKQVTLRGTAGIKIVIHPASGVGTYSGPTDVVTTFPQLLEARRSATSRATPPGDWGCGTSRASGCSRSPGRLGSWSTCRPNLLRNSRRCVGLSAG